MAIANRVLQCFRRLFKSLYFTFIFRAIWIVEGALSMFHILVIASYISGAILEAICSLIDKTITMVNATETSVTIVKVVHLL